MKAQTTAKLTQLRISPQKVRLVVDMVRGMNANEAVLQLAHSPKSAARPIKKLIESAMANASHNHHMIGESLIVKTATVNEGPTLMRWMPRAFGRATKIRKRTSHINLVLEGDVAEATKAKAAEKKVPKPAKQEEPPKAEEKKAASKAKKTTKKA